MNHAKGFPVLFLNCLLILFLYPAICFALTLEEYVTPTPDSSPTDLAFAPDGTLWFTMINANKIGKLEPDKVKNGTSEGITEYKVPHADARPNFIMVARDGMVWFTEMAGNRISQINPANGKYKGYDIPTSASEPHTLVEDDDGNIWFVEFMANKVGRLNPKTGAIREFPIGSGNPHGIARVGKDIWYTQGGKFWTKQKYNKVGVLNTASGDFREVIVPPKNSVPHGMTATSDGTVWFTAMFVSKLIRMHPDGKGFDEFPVGKRRGPHDVKVDEKRGWVWFPASHPDAMGRLDLSKAQPGQEVGVDYFKVEKGAHPRKVEIGPDGSAWFTEMGMFFRGKYWNKIGRLIP